MKRREFLKTAGLLTGSAILSLSCEQQKNEQPNILWITCEDMSPHLGCYGDDAAITPNLDRLAREGVRYDNAYATAPLCTPARSSLITGIFASTLGTQHLRGVVPKPDSIKCFTEYLRKNGYYCSNNVKEDYNFSTPDAAWDESSETAHWRKRPKDKPFFSVFNFMTTHQSRTRYGKDELQKVNQELPASRQYDPDNTPLPPFYPDTETVRINMTAFYTQVTRMDQQVQNILDQLEKDDLAEDTIVFFYSDHGDGLPRGKRWLHDTGIKVALIIRFPEKYQHLAPAKSGENTDRLVSFADFGPTVLSLANIETPNIAQGRPFLGHFDATPRQHIVAIRDRVDEVLECSRTLHDGRYQYIRNFLPHRPRMQRSFYSERTPIRQELRRLHKAGQLSGPETWLMQPSKPVEELYDTKEDPWELKNLAGQDEFQDRLKEMRSILYDWILQTRDLSFLHETQMLERADGEPPFFVGQDPNRYPLERILEMADRVGRGPDHLSALKAGCADPDSAVRYWAATGLAALGKKAQPALTALKASLNDVSPAVRFTAAEALCNLDECSAAVQVLAEGLSHEDIRVALHATEILVVIDEKARPALPEMQATIERTEDMQDHGWYMREALMYLVGKLKG